MSKRDALKLLRRLVFAHTMVGDAYKARAYTNAIWPLSRVEGDFDEQVRSGSISGVQGVGKGVLRVLEASLEGTEPAVLQELEAEIPQGLFAVAGLRGLGPGKVKALWTELGVTSLADLEYAAEENRLVSLKGFGAKTQDKVLAALAQARENAELVRRDQAMDAAELVLPLVDGGVIAGDLRRGCEVVRVLEIVCLGTPETLAAVVTGEVDGERVVLQCDGVPVWLWPTSAERFGTVLVQRTGSEAYLAGLGPLPDGPTEEAVYAALGQLPVAPERREAGAPVFRPGQARPRLVRRSDLQGALHNHTVASDGRNTLEEMCAAAAALGLSYLGISEHSQTASYAGGLSPEALQGQNRAIRAQTASNCVVLSGIESDILADGQLDYDAGLLEPLDFVVASVHARHKQGPEAMTERMVRAVHNRFSDVIGHPTGRLLLGRPPTGVDMAALLDACAETGTAIELNGSPHRLDLSVEHLCMAKERGVIVSIAADAHSVEGLNNLDHGIASARRAGLRAEDVLNTLDVDGLRAWVAQRRARGGAA